MVAMVPYVVRDGDHFQEIAARLGFDADAVWTDPANADLADERGSMHILNPGDVLYVPDPKEQRKKWLGAVVGSTNQFVASIPTIDLSVTFTSEGEPIAGEPCVVWELPELKNLKTKGDGSLDLTVPMSRREITVEFTNLGIYQVLRIGALDPSITPRGMSQRISNLGLDRPRDPDAEADPADDDLRNAVRAYLDANAEGDDTDDGDDADDDSDDTEDGDDSDDADDDGSETGAEDPSNTQDEEEGEQDDLPVDALALAEKLAKAYGC